MQVVQGTLVAGDDLGGEDHGVAGLEAYARVLAGGDPAEHGTGLALASGREPQHLAARQLAGGPLVEQRRQALQVADLARRLDHAMHRATDRRGMATDRLGHAHSGLETRDVGGERGHDDAICEPADQRSQAVAHLRFRTGSARIEDVGRVADHGEHAFPAEGFEVIDRGQRPDQRRRVKLPVARVQHIAERGAERERMRFGNRVRDAHQAAIEWPDHEPLARRNHVQRSALDPCIVELASQHRCGEPGAVDGTAQPFPEVGQRAEVILVSMRQHQTGQTLPALGDEGRIGQHNLDPWQGFVGKAEPQVDHQPLAVQLIQIEIEPDFAGATEGHEQQLPFRHPLALQFDACGRSA